MSLYGFAGGDPVNFSDPLGLCKNAKGEEVHPRECEKSSIEPVVSDETAARLALAAVSEVAAAAEGVEALAEIAAKLTVRFGPQVSTSLSAMTGAVNHVWVNARTGMQHILRLETHPLTPGGPDVTHINYEQHVPKAKPGRFTQIQDIHLDINGHPIP